jgi:hypothetical protein
MRELPTLVGTDPRIGLGGQGWLDFEIEEPLGRILEADHPKENCRASHEQRRIVSIVTGSRLNSDSRKYWVTGGGSGKTSAREARRVLARDTTFEMLFVERAQPPELWVVLVATATEYVSMNDVCDHSLL